MEIKNIKLADGSGGVEMQKLISLIRKNIPFVGKWKHTDEDAANLELADFIFLFPLSKNTNKKDGFLSFIKEKNLVFTTDAFVVSPIFFRGGNIGDLAFNGTVNDLLMEGAYPLGISLAIVIEEGFLISDLEKILKTIGTLSSKTKIPVVTGDTKVVGKGALDKIMITTAGLGFSENIISDSGLRLGDKIIVSGDLGAHGATLLAHRFNYKTSLQSDTKSLIRELRTVGRYLTSAKDSTRGGIAAVINEMAGKSAVKIILYENKIPIKKEVNSISNLLGINRFSLASEGRFVAGVKKENAEKVEKKLKLFNHNARVIGEVQEGEGVFLDGLLGKKRLDIPSGILIPRIC